MELIEAMKTLDVTNDDQWTADGQARLEVLSELTGSKVTRDQVRAVCPTFCKAKPEIVQQEVKSNPFAKPQEPVVQEPVVQEPVVQEPVVQESGEFINVDEEVAKAAVLNERDKSVIEEELEAQEKVVAESLAVSEKARKEYEQQLKVRDKLVNELSKHSTAKQSQADIIKQFQANEHKKRANGLI